MRLVIQIGIGSIGTKGPIWRPEPGARRQDGPPMIEDNRCASWVGFGRRIEMKSRFRSAISPWIDRRKKLDIIRDELEERGLALLQQTELVSRPLLALTRILLPIGGFQAT